MDPKDGSSTTPAWAEEFSVHASEDAYVQRRQFTKFLVLTSFGMVAGNGWILLKAITAEERSEWPQAVIAQASQIEAGTVRFFTYPESTDPCILVRRTNGEFAAFSQKCTHLSCAVYYAPQKDRLECPCHEGYFSAANGRVLQGPPPRPLPQVILEQRGDDLVAVGLTTHGAEE
ncbi:MAG TPA: ubiquinol-cytochrome c reductase iron-sulfur subunit [Vicinamibacterales bacterium]|jgi:Rieske Fe-S protein|nr:ubiquinol-cytochrome c reductase iron-sulfur subunit [Vicinamibacterales bacterium]